MKTIYSAGPVQHAIVNDVKNPLKEGLQVLYDGALSLGHLRPLWKAYQAMKKLPEPTKENTQHPNTRILIDLRDEFFRWEDNPGYMKIWKAIWNFVIILYDFDAYYRDRIDWVMEKLFTFSHLWQRRGPYKPRMTFWREHDEKRARHIAEKQACMEGAK